MLARIEPSAKFYYPFLADNLDQSLFFGFATTSPQYVKFNIGNMVLLFQSSNNATRPPGRLVAHRSVGIIHLLDY